MSKGFQLTPSAQSDVDRITDFIAEDNVEAALRVHDALEEEAPVGGDPVGSHTV